MASHGQEGLYPDFSSHDHACNACSRNVSPDRSLTAKLEECTCAEESVPGSPGSASITDYCAEVGAPSTPANASITGFSPLIAQSVEWAHGGQRSVHTSPYSPCRTNKIDRTYSFTPGSRPTAQELGSSANQALHLMPFDGRSHERSETVPLSETTPGRFSTRPDHHIIPMTPAVGLGGLRQQSQASLDSVERYLDSLQDNTTRGIAQDECSNYSTEDSDDTSDDSESNDEFNAFVNITLKGSEIYTNEASAAILELAKKALINQLMQEFWVRFDKNWMEKFTTSAGSETASISPSRQRLSLSAQATIPKRQRGEAEDGDSSSDDNGRAHKRFTPQKIPPDGEEKALSCPFRKRDPGKYRLPNYRVCALSSWTKIGRVKEHIYRYHRAPIHCGACWAVFKSDDLLQSHLGDEANRCHIRPSQVFDGITPKTETLLRSRRKEYRGQTDAEIWRKIYSIIFPDEFVPSPYYQTIRDEPDGQEDAIYHAYLRRTIPRLVSTRIESLVKSQFPAFIDTIKTTLDEIMLDCIDRAWIIYKTERVTRDPAAIGTHGAVQTPMESTLPEVVGTHKQNVSISSVPELQSVFDHANNFTQSPGPPPTPGDPALAHGCYEANDMELTYGDQNALLGCYCPMNACNCADRQIQTQFLPSATLEFNTPGKTLENGMLAEDWNQDGLLVAADFEEDTLRTDWHF